MFRIDLVLLEIGVQRLCVVVVPVPGRLVVVRQVQFLVATAELKIGVRMCRVQLHGPLEVIPPVRVAADQPALVALVHVGQSHDILVFRVCRVQAHRLA